ncbi:hypothetical protein [Puerhibacterium puerhi]|uniref:hypothetical protein n=1 Tax=Puerhibacterium puerhi TaxID=2692623 RepID=UPI0013597559|nr:hypothetical protein [Puerhibacterium puerhi]
MKFKMPSAKTRRYLYRVGNAAVAVAVGYGLLNGEEGALWGLLLNALLGLADANTPAESSESE